MYSFHRSSDKLLCATGYYRKTEPMIIQRTKIFWLPVRINISTIQLLHLRFRKQFGRPGISNRNRHGNKMVAMNFCLLDLLDRLLQCSLITMDA